jgi:SAM-dependent methyltransferase
MPASTILDAHRAPPTPGPALTSADFSDADLYRFGLGLGLRTLPRQPLLGAKTLALPVEYIRCAEARYVLKHLAVEGHHRVLDVGSPKLPSLFLAARLRARVHATDLVDYFFARYGAYAHAVLPSPSDLYRMEVQDARGLSYADEAFDRVFSISAIEHIPEDGDRIAMGEIARVLKPGGLCCLTVPWGLQGYVEEFRQSGDPDVYWVESREKKMFYQRAYDRPSLESRLLADDRLELLDLDFWGERHVGVEHTILNRRLPRLLRLALLPAHFFLSRAFVSRLGEDEPCRKKVACLTLRKRDTSH